MSDASTLSAIDAAAAAAAASAASAAAASAASCASASAAAASGSAALSAASASARKQALGIGGMINVVAAALLAAAAAALFLISAIIACRDISASSSDGMSDAASAGVLRVTIAVSAIAVSLLRGNGHIIVICRLSICSCMYAYATKICNTDMSYKYSIQISPTICNTEMKKKIQE